MKIFILLLSLIFTFNLFAYPEMVTHGYGNCISCHVSSTGGGLLTPYGRALSKELLSVKWPVKSANGTEQFMYDSISLPKKLNMGGDVRFLQMFMDNQYESSGRGILMQADIEAAYTLDKRTRIQATAGRQEISNAKKITDQFISRRHWVNFLIGKEDNLEEHQIRVGRYFPAYGLNIADHSSQIKKGLGFDQGQETYNIEYAYLGESWNFISTLITGRPDKKELGKEEGGAIQLSYTLNSKNKIGTNFFTGIAPNKGSADRKTMMGVYGIFSLTPKLYSLVEFDRSFTPRKNYGLYEYLKFGYEYRQGLHLFLAAEYSRPSIYASQKTLKGLDVGVKVFPWVHWEFETYYRKEDNRLTQNVKSDMFILQAHFYL